MGLESSLCDVLARIVDSLLEAAEAWVRIGALAGDSASCCCDQQLLVGKLDTNVNKLGLPRLATLAAWILDLVMVSRSI
jgi:hypothetical protein